MGRKTILKLSALLICAVMAVNMCGCAAVNDIHNGASFSQVLDSFSADLFGEEDQAYTQVSVTLPRHPGYAAIEDKTAYAALRSDEERQAYLSIEQSIFRVTDNQENEDGVYQLCRALIPSLNSVQIFKVKEAVLADHPEAFWLSGDYSLGRNAHDGLYIIMQSSLSAEEISSRSQALTERISLILKEIPSGLSEYDRELIIHDCIVRDVQYDEAAAADISSTDPAATVYGTMVNGRAVCTGYARTAKLLLNRVGISCMTVKGMCSDEGHMWNLVSVNGNWYHMDITWDDPVEFNAYGVFSHNYFNLTDAEISANHVISPDYIMLTEGVVEDQDENAQNFYNFNLPKCTSTEDNFYRLNALYIDQLNIDGEEAVFEAVKSCAESGEDMFYLVFPDNYNDYVTLENWFNDAVLTAVGTVNQEELETGSLRKIDTYKYSSVTEENWCNVYVFKLLFQEQNNI